MLNQINIQYKNITLDLHLSQSIIIIFQFNMKRTQNLAYQISKMANYASKPLHPPTTDRWVYGSGRTPHHLKISLWNVNGLRSVIKKGDFQNYMKMADPDIMCINETKMDLSAFEKEKQLLKDFEEYRQYWNFCKVSKGYSGVATLSKYEPISAIEDFQCDYLALEGRCLTLEFEKFFLVNCYKPNAGTKLQRLEKRTQLYDQKFLQYVNNLKTQKNVIIVGDMNVAHKQIDLARPQMNKRNAGFTNEERSEFTKLISTGFIDTFRFFYPEQIKYTWWSTRSDARFNNVGWRIDYILTNDLSIVKDSQVRDDIYGSDHCPIEGIFQLK